MKQPLSRVVFWSVSGGVLALVAVLGILRGPPKGPERAELLPIEQQTELLRFTRALLTGTPLPMLSPALRRVCGRHVFVELFQPRRTNFIYAVSEQQKSAELCLPEAIQSAASSLMAKPEFQGFAKRLGETRLALELQRSALNPIKWSHYGRGGRNASTRKGWRLDPKKFSLGRDALLLQGKDAVTWVPKMEAVAVDHGFGDLFTKLRKYTAHHLSDVSIQASRARKRKPEAEAFAFRTQMILESRPGEAERPLSPKRGDLAYGRVDADDLFDTATQMTDYLVRVLDKDGKFDYEYYANRDRSSKDYNIVRHAGTTYSLLFSYKMTGNRKYLGAGFRAKKYIAKKLKRLDYKAHAYHSAKDAVRAPFPAEAGHVPLLALTEGKKSSLGATALTLLAFAQIPASELSAADQRRVEGMANFVWYLQCESGGFYTNYAQAQKGECPDPQPKFYPGEALLALNALHQIHPNPSYLEIARRSIKFELEVFYGGQFPDHWVMQALELMQQNAPEEAQENDWIQAGLDMGQKYLEYQYLSGRDYARKPKFREFDGAVSATLGLSNNSPTGSMSEAIAAIYRLMKNTGRAKEQQRFGDHLLASAHLLTREMYRPENTFFLANPKKAMGGLPTNSVDQSVRFDANQHALVAVWGAWQVALDRGGIGWPLPTGAVAEELRAKAAAGSLVTKKKEP